MCIGKLAGNDLSATDMRLCLLSSLTVDTISESADLSCALSTNQDLLYLEGFFLHLQKVLQPYVLLYLETPVPLRTLLVLKSGNAGSTL